MSWRTTGDVAQPSDGAPDSDPYTTAIGGHPLPSSPSVGSDLRQLSQTIISSLQWINDFNPTNIFANFLSANPFRRRGSSKPNDQIDSTKSYRSYDVDDRPLARLLNGTLIPTAKSTELIELANFGLIEIDHKESGVGHDFQVSLCCMTNDGSIDEFSYSVQIVGRNDFG